MPAIVMLRLPVVRIAPRITRVIRSRLRDIRLKRILHALWIAASPWILLIPTTAQATITFTDNFDGTSLQGAYWTPNRYLDGTIAPGTFSVSAGIVNLGCKSQADTRGKYEFSGNQVVIEGKFSGTGGLRDTKFILVDVADSNNAIFAGDTNYGAYGFYTSTTGAFNLPMAGTGNSTNAYKEYRLTLTGTTLTWERGDTLANITQTTTRTLGVSIAGKTFYLYIGTGGPDYCPASFDWVRVISETAKIGNATGMLNDTGITFCGDASTNTANCASVAADGGAYPRQDARYGRDAQAAAGQLTKVGGGGKGFDYSKIANNGTVLPESAVLGAGPTDWACTRDNVTGLIWEVKTSSGLRSQSHTYTWYNSNPASNGGAVGTASGGTCFAAGRCDTEKFVLDVNAAGLCGASDWRMPKVKELEGIADFGRVSPAIDPTYFPNTSSSFFWSGSPSAYYSSFACVVDFGDGGAYVNGRSSNGYLVRLVRGGQ